MLPGAAATWVDPEIALNRRWTEQVFPPGRDGLTADDALPFSFVYGGRHSSEFINDCVLSKVMVHTCHRAKQVL